MCYVNYITNYVSKQVSNFHHHKNKLNKRKTYIAFSNKSTIEKLNCNLKQKIYVYIYIYYMCECYIRGAMAGITQKSCVALFPLWSLKKNFVKADVNKQKHTKKIQSLNLIRSHVSMMTAVTVIIISLITNIKIAIILIPITKNDYHNNNNSSNNNNNDNNNNNNNRSLFEIN